MTKKWPILSLTAAILAMAVRSPSHAGDLVATLPATLPAARTWPVDAASQVTLHVTGQSIENVLQEITRQTGNKLVLPPHFRQNMGNRRNPQLDALTIDVDGVPFFKVLIDLCAQTQRRIVPQIDGTFMLVERNDGLADEWAGPTLIANGPVLMVVEEVEHVNQLTAPADQADYCAVGFRGLCEPRLQFLCYQSGLIPDQARDENGLSLVPAAWQDDPKVAKVPYFQPDTRITASEPSGPVAGYLHSRIPLAVTAKAGHRIAEVKGQFKMWLVSKYDTVEIRSTDPVPEKLGDNSNFRTLSSGMKLHLQRVRQDRGFVARGKVAIGIGLVRENESDEQWKMQVRQLHAAHVSYLDTNGRAKTDEGRGNGGEAWLYSIYDDTDGDKAMVVIPVAVTEVVVPYTFTDLPLP